MSLEGLRMPDELEEFDGALRRGVSPAVACRIFAEAIRERGKRMIAWADAIDAALGPKEKVPRR